MDFNKFFQSKAFKVSLIALGLFIIILVSFQAGLLVGFRKAGFSYRWEENYHRNFAGPKGGFIDDLRGREFIESSGVFGPIIKIDGQSVVIRGKDNVEKIIMIKSDAVIRRGKENLKLSDLRVDDPLVVIGEPNDAGQIEAKLIRVMPPLPAGSFNPASTSADDFLPPPPQF
ncbi:MAG TPA: hypothetical protein P5267_00105 [Patescibacteria group bacterium]|nr:hypothetical protein [Patescibacteria group bacterium]